MTKIDLNNLCGGITRGNAAFGIVAQQVRAAAVQYLTDGMNGKPCGSMPLARPVADFLRWPGDFVQC